MKKTFTAILAGITVSLSVYAQKGPENSDARMYFPQYGISKRTEISIPDIDGFITLKADFHTHTMFADAQLSPEGRVNEAWCDGLDIICVSEHVGVHKSPGIPRFDLNLVTKRAVDAGKKYGLIVIPGVEISREKPFGHMNAMFLTDCSVFHDERYKWDGDGNEMKGPDGKRIPMRETEIPDFEAAEKQGAFIQWNHPGWPDNMCPLPDFHRSMIQQGRIHAVELFNSYEMYPAVMDWMDEYGITVTANSDAHEPIRCMFGDSMRPLNLVFAREATLESVKEAMFAGRMLAVWNNRLAGKAELISQLIDKCLKIKKLDSQRVQITNISDICFTVLYAGHTSPVDFPARQSIILKLSPGEVLNFTNCIIGRGTLEKSIY